MNDNNILQYGNNLFNHGNKPDIVGDKYKIDLTKKLGAYSNTYIDMYEAIDISSETEYYLAAVLNPRRVHRFALIKYLVENRIPKLFSPIIAQITPISDRNIHCLVIILKKHNYTSLYDYIYRDKKIISEEIIQTKLIPDIITALNHIHSSGHIHGNINLKNIFITDNNNFIVNECFLNPCGYHQFIEYETAERIKTTPDYKNSLDPSIDYYALGILCAYLIVPNLNLSKYDSNSLIKLKLEQGTFQIITEKIYLPKLFKSLIRGLVADVSNERWEFNAVLEWCKGKKGSNRIFVTKNLMRSYKVLEKEFFDLTVLANELSDNWSLCKEILEDSRLHKWIEKTLSDEKTAERLSYSVQLMQAKHSIVKIDSDSFVSRSLVTIDSIGPIRHKHLIFTIDSLSSLLTNTFTDNKKDQVNIINKLIRDTILDYAISLYGEINRSINKEIAFVLEETNFFFLRGESGFGLERLLYSLEPEFPCQGHLVLKYYITNITTLLEALEKIAKNIEVDRLIDEHIKSFIYAKLKIGKPIKIHHLGSHKGFNNNKILNDLILLSYVQEQLDNISLPNITKFMQSKLQDIIKLYHHKKTRESLTKELIEIAKSGNLEKMLLKVANPTLINKDIKEFMLAAAKYKALDKELEKLGSQEKKHIFNKGHSIGLKMALMLSYFICTFFAIGYTLMNI